MAIYWVTFRYLKTTAYCVQADSSVEALNKAQDDLIRDEKNMPHTVSTEIKEAPSA